MSSPQNSGSSATPTARPGSGVISGRGAISRRQVLGLLGGSAGSLLISGCGTDPTPAELAYVAEDFSGAQISAIMRKAFDPEIDELTRTLGQEWGAGANASISFSVRDDWREAYTEVAEARKGEDIAELFGNGAHLFSDRLVDLSDLVEEIDAGSSGWIPAAKDAAQVEGVWRAVPWSYTALALNYRESHLHEIGADVPRTYNDLLDVATALKENGLPQVGFTMSPDGPRLGKPCVFDVVGIRWPRG